MDHTLSCMIQQSRLGAARVRARLAVVSEGGAPADADALFEEAAGALLACRLVEARGGPLVRTGAERLRRELEAQLDGLRREREINRRLVAKAAGLAALLGAPAGVGGREEASPPAA